MNPPSAIHSAMSRDRKPFTYTPGGIDLSEIKSERMAKRIMRNAMNQGISEVPAQSVQSPSIPSSHVIVPNFNCLPVQVFPAFNLPANPKSLLRSRSNPDQPKEPIGQRTNIQQSDNFNKPNGGNIEEFNNNLQSYSQINNNRPASMYEYGTNYFTEPLISYKGLDYKEPGLTEIPKGPEYLIMSPEKGQVGDDKIKYLKTVQAVKSTNENCDNVINVPVELNSVTTLDNAHTIRTPVDDETGKNKQSEVNVKKSVKTERTTEEHRQQNGNQDEDIKAELTVQLPNKKIGPKIETKVEVTKKLLPDGSVEETKKTITKTTVDGKTDVKTETETRILSEEEAEKEIEIVEEEEEEEEEEEIEETEEGAVQEQANDEKIKQSVIKQDNNNKKNNESTTIKENGQEQKIIKTEQKSEITTTTTQKVVVVQSDDEEEVEEEEVEEEEEEIEENEPVITVSIKKTEKLSTPPIEIIETHVEKNQAEEDKKNHSDLIKDNSIDEKKDDQIVDVELKVDEQDNEDKIKNQKESVNVENNVELETEKEEEQNDEVYEEAQETEMKNETEIEKLPDNIDDKNKIEEKTYSQPDVCENNVVETDTVPKEDIIKKIEVQIINSTNDEREKIKEETTEPEPIKERNIPLREPSIPLDKIDDIEIKPIGLPGLITKTHTEKTEIITSSNDQPSGVHSTQTEYNRIENIVTVNRTTKTLDNTYDNVPQQESPPMNTYFTPSRILSSPMHTTPYQPVYPPVATERRHSLLLERLSVDRQMPSEIYHNQTYEQQRQTSQEPQSEVLTISNVKPSKITNQQWYQQSKETVQNTVASTPLPSDTQSWVQPQPKAQPQPTYKPQPTYPPPQSYQPQQTFQPQQPYQSQTSYQPQQSYQPPQSFQTQTTYQPQKSYPPQPSPQPQYQSSYIEPLQTNKFSTFTPKPVNRINSFEPTPNSNISSNLYSFNKDSTESYQKSTQQYSSSYVPPPWEQDSNYTADYNQNYYQPPTTGTLHPTTTPAQSWKPTPPKGKFSKPPPTAYIPPAPNQSFVKAVSNVEPPKQTGRKTYYSEYERRYISVPESTYIPNETKFQPQPDPSPKYYYDNNESNENVEHQWRKELREFTEKTSQTQTQSDQAPIKPPWEAEPKYAKATDLNNTPTPTWSQTVRPRSWRERSFESEYVGSQEWPKTNTLGRGRPLTTFNKSETILERTRGVSVDRYNPNSYQPPATLEHPPVQTHTLPTPAPHGTYHNPNVPAYHSRVSDESREQQPPSYKQPRVIREQRASPFQSRSFKYLQWITGTED